jgi:hypothetical protein
MQGAWMVSPVHHDNLMNANIDHIGVGLVAAHGMLYAVVDFTKSVQSLTPAQVESAVGKLLTEKGLTLLPDATAARRYCALADGASSADLGLRARSLVRWQSGDAQKLPPQLAQQLAGGQFRQASVGACKPQGSGAVAGGPVFSGYRVAVLLY